MKKAGSAVNKTIKQTKAAISISLPQCFATDEAFEDGVLTYDTRASGPKFNRPDHERWINDDFRRSRIKNAA